MARNFSSNRRRFYTYYDFPELRIRKRLPPEAEATTPVFTNKKYLGGFKISSDLEYILDGQEGNPMPKAVKVDEVPGRLLEKPLNLADNYEENNIIDDYYPYWQTMMKYFYQWLIDTEYFESRESIVSWRAAAQNSRRKPDFVTLNGNITDFLVTPYESRYGWCIYARRFKGTIYLRSTREAQSESKLPLSQSKPMRARNDISDRNAFEKNATSHVGLEFKRQVLQLDSNVKQHEKVFAFYETDFGKYKILTLNEVHAVESCSDPKSPSFVDIKVVRSSSPKSYFRQLLPRWARSVIFNQKKIIVGQTTENTSLTNVNIESTEDIPSDAKELWQPHVCSDFLKRLLGFINQKVDTEDPNIVFCFQRRELPVVTFSRLTVKDTGLNDDFKAVIPKSFVEHFDIQKSVAQKVTI